MPKPWWSTRVVPHVPCANKYLSYCHIQRTVDGRINFFRNHKVPRTVLLRGSIRSRPAGNDLFILTPIYNCEVRTKRANLSCIQMNWTCADFNYLTFCFAAASKKAVFTNSYLYNTLYYLKKDWFSKQPVPLSIELSLSSILLAVR